MAAPETSAERDTRMAWWREAHLGMFVHWGLHSGLAGNWNGKMVADKGGLEWIQKIVGADTDTYAAQAVPKFKPTPGFAKEWARLAKQAGCQYVVFTTKHHEGFALHDSIIPIRFQAPGEGRDHRAVCCEKGDSVSGRKFPQGDSRANGNKHRASSRSA